MGICNVLAVVPFLCAAAPEEAEPEQEEEVVGHVIEGQPATEVVVDNLAPPEGAAHTMTEYQVLAPSTIYRDGLSAEELAAAQADLFPEDPENFSEWVGQNYAGQQDVEAPAPTLALRVEEPELPEETPVIATASATPGAITPVSGYVVAEPVVTENMVADTPPAETMVAEVPPAPASSRPVVQELQLYPNNVATARVSTPPQPVPDPEPVMEVQQVAMAPVRDPAPTVSQAEPAAMTFTPRSTPRLTGRKADEAQELIAPHVVFTEPVAFSQRGESIATEGIAQRKRQHFRRYQRELRRAARRAEGQGS